MSTVATVPVSSIKSSLTIFDPKPANSVIRLRPSTINSWGMCSKAVGYSSAGIKPEVLSANLVFGTIGHLVIEYYIRGYLRADELPAFFKAEWTKAKKEKAISYAKTVSWDTLLEIGMYLVGLFPDWWRGTGFKPLLQEHRMEVDIGNNVIITAMPDMIAEATKPLFDARGYQMVREGDVAVLDWKFPTAGAEAKPGFAQKAKQPTYYHIAFNAHCKSLGLPETNAVGFVDLVKKNMPKTSKGSMPYIHEPFLYGRSKSQINEAIRYAHWIADQMRAGNYFEEPLMAFNSPCEGMIACDYLTLCQSGYDTDGLFVPNNITPEMLAYCA